jgi:hypothetical protein
MAVVHNSVLNVVRVVGVDWSVMMFQEDMGVNSSIVLNGLNDSRNNHSTTLINVCMRRYIQAISPSTYLGSRNLYALFTLVVIVTPRDLLSGPNRFSVVVGEIGILRGVDGEIHIKASRPQRQKCFG